MRLQRVRIYGFKTFADKTEFNLDGGVVAVVGPNGCGKSNIVDAILWALGEANVKQLRGQVAQDVIFSGSAHRKPLGFAEVTLYFNNEDGVLPVAASEVAVTRRITRAGESEYSINKKACRLKDIHELLADSGLGRSGYAIVGQKEIDQALAASPIERRAWVDEAAGVQRYRTRKVESLRRLAAAEDHLARVQAILIELEAQREPLKEEAEAAAKYRALQTALQDIERGLLIQEVGEAVAEIKECDERITATLAAQREQERLTSSYDTEMPMLEAQLATLEREALAFNEQLRQVAMDKERVNTETLLANERLQHLQGLEESLKSSKVDWQARIDTEALEVKTCQEELDRLKAELSELEGGSGNLAGELMLLKAQLADAEKHLEEQRRFAQENSHHEATVKVKESRIKEIVRELAGIRKDLPGLQAAADEQRSVVAALKDEPAQLRAENKRIDDETVMLRRAEDQENQRLMEKQREKSSLEGRIRGIESTIHSHEGLSYGSKAVLDAAADGRLKGSYVPVGEAISARNHCALAIETALGAASGDLIVEHDSDAKVAIKYLSAGKLGRVTFQPIPLMRPQVVSHELQQLLREKGVVGRASELVDCDHKYRPVIDSLLGRVVIVENLDTALKFAKTTGWSRMVTLEGEVVHSSGAVTGGVQQRAGFGMVQRKAELAKLEADLVALTRATQEMESKEGNLRRSRQALALKQQENLKRLRELDAAVREADEYLTKLDAEVAESTRSEHRLESERQRLEEADAWVPHQVDIPLAEKERDTLSQRLVEATLTQDSTTARTQELFRQIQQSEQRLQASEYRLSKSRAEHEAGDKKADRLHADREKLHEELAACEHKQAQLALKASGIETELGELVLRRTDAKEAIEKLQAATKDIAANTSALTTALHQAELRKVRAESKRATLGIRLLEEYGLTTDDAYAHRNMQEVAADAAQIVSRLRRDMRAMGDVNLGAIEAYERLTNRFDELENQKSDIQVGIEQVRLSIHELDKLTRDKFVDTFDKLKVEFAQLFTRLFGGGTGELNLSDPNNILETGIDIDVQLPGKRRQRLEVLSGGERALCAAAFLFALLTVKPSPLVVLDEVDAPLDGRNVEQFANVLNEFSGRMQFIVITHNPTTIERAPVWLGVTMSEPGVSTLVPARIPEGYSTKAGGDKVAKTSQRS